MSRVAELPLNDDQLLPRPLPAEAVTVRRAQPDDVAALAPMLARAFDQDPFTNWLVRQDERRVQRIEWSFEVMLRQLSSELSETYVTQDLDGAAIWKQEVKLPFGQQLRLLPAFARAMGWGRVPALLKMLSYMEPLHQRLVPEPHFYLFVLGVDPEQQRRGLGSLLLAPMLARCDQKRTRAYLETTRAENLQFYARHGFEVAHIVEREGWPKFWLMIREPRELQ